MMSMVVNLKIRLSMMMIAGYDDYDVYDGDYDGDGIEGYDYDENGNYY